MIKDKEGNERAQCCLPKSCSSRRVAEASRDEEPFLDAILSISASLNHEINNPLTSILGNAQLLLLSSFGEDASVRKRLKLIEREAIKIRRIVSRLAFLVSPAFFDYAGGKQLVDLRESRYRDWIGEED